MDEVHPTAFAVVRDVAATWERYQPAEGPVASGLILHVAGPTDDGFRTIDVWESEEAWRAAGTDAVITADLVVTPVVRELQVRDLVLGAWHD